MRILPVGFQQQSWVQLRFEFFAIGIDCFYHISCKPSERCLHYRRIATLSIAKSSSYAFFSIASVSTAGLPVSLVNRRKKHTICRHSLLQKLRSFSDAELSCSLKRHIVNRQFRYSLMLPLFCCRFHLPYTSSYLLVGWLHCYNLSMILLWCNRWRKLGESPSNLRCWSHPIIIIG